MKTGRLIILMMALMVFQSVPQEATAQTGNAGTGPDKKADLQSLSDSCISLPQVQRTEIIDDQTILFHLHSKRVKKVLLAFPCPSLKFYGSFSYEVYSNRLCSRVDTIVSRAGTHCPISDIITLPAPEENAAPDQP